MARLDEAKDAVRSEYKTIQTAQSKQSKDSKGSDVLGEAKSLDTCREVDSRRWELGDDLALVKARHERSIRILQDELELNKEIEKRKLEDRLDKRRNEKALLESKAKEVAADGQDDSSPIETDYSILEKMTEYLFDLWDANCMEEFKIIEAFENRAMLAFSTLTEEYTFEQEQLHKEFLVLFEDLLDKFLKEEDITSSQFYKAVHDYSEEQIPKASPDCKEERGKHAMEVIDVISYFTSFETWAQAMRERVIESSRFRRDCSFQGQMGEAMRSIKMAEAALRAETLQNIGEGI